MKLQFLKAALLATALAGGLAAPALAHHGWSWTETGFFQLEGIVKAVYLGNPHATIDLDVEGTVWRVELAPPGPTTAAGFVEGAVKAGDEITAIGNRSVDHNETRMKAVRIVFGDKTFDVYPDRAKQI
ncbi:MAG TPA: DUF6152 family protein [Devosia sp.]|nr:DUF6152 family protein [Devosia sp.]